MPVIVSNNQTRTVVVNRSRSVSTVDAGGPATIVQDRKTVNTAVQVSKTTNIAGIGAQGPRGQAGANGDKVLIPRTTPAVIGGHRVVYSVNASDVAIASFDDLVNSDNILGITTQASIAGGDTQVQTYGPLTEPGWAWTTGQPLYLTNNGLMTHTPPVSGVQLQIGYAESATTVFIDIDTPIYFED